MPKPYVALVLKRVPFIDILECANTNVDGDGSTIFKTVYLFQLKQASSCMGATINKKCSESTLF